MSARPRRVTVRNADFQQWEALLGNRSKRHRTRRFLVHGVRPISLAVEHGWRIETWIQAEGRSPSRWATDVQAAADADQVLMSALLLAELGEKGEDVPELVAVVVMPEDDASRIPTPPDFLGVLLDRPTSPGNLGSIIRSADAFGAQGVLVSGHGADPYDPRAVRASTGSLFAVPTVRAPGPDDVLSWVAEVRQAGVPLQLVGTDETGSLDVFDADLTGPVLLLVGNETRGLSGSWREAADQMVRIPMVGAASSLNAANAATAVLYEVSRQRTPDDRLSRGSLA